MISRFLGFGLLKITKQWNIWNIYYTNWFWLFNVYIYYNIYNTLWVNNFSYKNFSLLSIFSKETKCRSLISVFMAPYLITSGASYRVLRIYTVWWSVNFDGTHTQSISWLAYYVSPNSASCYDIGTTLRAIPYVGLNLGDTYLRTVASTYLLLYFLISTPTSLMKTSVALTQTFFLYNLIISPILCELLTS